MINKGANKMKRLSLLLAGATIFAGICVHAEESKNLVVNGNAADGSDYWRCSHDDTSIPIEVIAGGPDGANCFEVTGHAWVFNTEHIPVDSNSEYRLTGWFKSGNDKANQVKLGLLLFDENKRSIDSTSVYVLEGSETVLAAEAQNGGTIIKVKDASTWEPLFQKKQLTVAFDADDSGEYTDLPNRNCYAVTGLEEKNGAWEVTLAKPISADFVAGTKVRAHRTSIHYTYAFEMKDHLAEWTEGSGVINPMVKSGAPQNAFWPGTKYVQILILANWQQKSGEVLQFGKISLEKVGPAK